MADRSTPTPPLFTQGGGPVAHQRSECAHSLCSRPWVLIFHVLRGLGAVMNDPAWKAMTLRSFAGTAASQSRGIPLDSTVERAVGPALAESWSPRWIGMVVPTERRSVLGVLFFVNGQARTHEAVPKQRSTVRHLRAFATCAAPGSALRPNSHGSLQAWGRISWLALCAVVIFASRTEPQGYGSC